VDAGLLLQRLENLHLAVAVCLCFATGVRADASAFLEGAVLSNS
jgi:hypothetical protein